jgi:hypothetical protein
VVFAFLVQNRRVQETTRMQLIQESIVRMEKSLEVCCVCVEQPVLCKACLLSADVSARVLLSCHFPAMSCQPVHGRVSNTASYLALQAEVKRRAESDKQLQTHFEGELRAIQVHTHVVRHRTWTGLS